MCRKTIELQAFIKSRNAIVDEILDEIFSMKADRDPYQVSALKISFGCYDSCLPPRELWATAIKELEQTRDTLRAESNNFLLR